MDLIVGLTLIVSIIISRTQFRYRRGQPREGEHAEPAGAD